MTSWRVARSIETFIAQANRQWPKRSRASDGTIGDAAHSARSSDHNPNDAGVVCAFDLTHDPAHGADCHLVFDNLRKARDGRAHYFIFDGQIVSSTTSPWQVRPYVPPPGGSMHREHLHLSVMQVAHLYDDPAPWPVFAPHPTSGADDVTPQDKKDIINGVVAALRDSDVFLVPNGMESAAHPKESKVSLGWISQATANAVQKVKEDVAGIKQKLKA